MDSEKALVQQISKRYGPVIDLDANPAAMIEIIRLIRSMYVSEPGTPGPPTRPGSVTNEDIMKAVLKLSRDVRAFGATRSKPGGKRATIAKRRRK